MRAAVSLDVPKGHDAMPEQEPRDSTVAAFGGQARRDLDSELESRDRDRRGHEVAARTIFAGLSHSLIRLRPGASVNTSARCVTVQVRTLPTAPEYPSADLESV